MIAEGHHQGGREGEQDLDQGLRTEEDLAEILTEEGQYQFNNITNHMHFSTKNLTDDRIRFLICSLQMIFFIGFYLSFVALVHMLWPIGHCCFFCGPSKLRMYKAPVAWPFLSFSAGALNLQLE